jgi:hypothetical protein
MAKFLRINSISEISPADLDGHKFQLSLDVGEVVGTEFVSRAKKNLDVTITGTLQQKWGIPDRFIAPPTGSLGTSTVVSRMMQGYPDPFEPVRLSTFSGASNPPQYNMATPGMLIPIPETELMAEPEISSIQITSLSDDISGIRDNINTLSIDLLGERILLLPQERALLDMYKDVRSAEEFASRIQSLAGLVVAINKSAILKSFDAEQTAEILTRHGIEDQNHLGSLVLLEELLTSYSNGVSAKRITEVFKSLNHLRQGFPAHGDNSQNVLKAHDFFKVRYPIRDFASAWETILGKYLEAMKEFLSVIREHRYKIVTGGKPT